MISIVEAKVNALLRALISRHLNTPPGWRVYDGLRKSIIPLPARFNLAGW